MRHQSPALSFLSLSFLLLVSLAGTTFAQNSNEISTPGSPGYASLPPIEMSSPAGAPPYRRLQENP